MPQASQNEQRVLLLAVFSATLMIAHQVAGKSTRDALFLSHFDVTSLPKMVIAAAVLSMVSVVIMSRLHHRFGPARLMPTVFGLSSVLYLGHWLLVETAPRLVSIALYFQMAAFSAVLISGFWSLISERFDPHTAKRNIARIAAAAALGGVVGGVSTDWVVRLLDLRAMFLVLFAAHLVCAFTIHGIGAGDRTVEDELPYAEGIRSLVRSPYLMSMSALVMVIAVTAAFLDYALKAEASARFQSSESMVTFFATFYSIVGILTFGVQTIIGPKFLRTFGIGRTLTVMPALIVFGGILSTMLLHLWTVVILRGTQSVFANSFFRSGFELLYTPVPRAVKRPAKAIIDVAADRAGDIAGGGIILALLWISADMPISVIVGLAIISGALALLLVRRLHRGYIDQLGNSLRSGAVQIQDEAGIDATTRETMEGLELVEEQKKILEKAKQSKSRREQRLALVPVSPQQPLNVEAREGLLARIASLRSGDPERILGVLAQAPVEAALVPHLIPLLAKPSVRSSVDAALKRVAASVTGQLVDAMIEPAQPMAVRHRIPRILETTESRRGIEGLMVGLDGQAFEVRFNCGRSLVHMIEANDSLRPPAKRLLELAEHELAVDPGTWKSQRPVAGQEHSGTLDHRPGEFSLEHLFRLLGLSADAEAMQVSRYALASDDQTLRGTALEYLENVLTPRLRAGLWRHLGYEAQAAPRQRATREVMNDLLRSAKALLREEGEEFAFPVASHGNARVISLAGELDLASSPKARRQMLDTLQSGHDLLVDMAQVTYMDSSTTAALVEALQLARARKLRFALASVGESPMRVLRLSRLDKIFSIYLTVEDAIAAVS